jgi:predicted acetyltransferase
MKKADAQDAADARKNNREKSMQIRKLEKEEHGKTRSIYETVFPFDSQSFVDYYYTEKTKDNDIYVIEEDGAIQSMIHLNPYALMVNGKEEASHYIVAVATMEAYRKRGYMAALLKETLNKMYEDREPFTFLMPAREGIYLPHGFRTVYEQKHSYKVEQDPVSRIVMEEDCDRLAAFAEKNLAQHFDVYAKRTPAYYERLLKEYGSDGGKLAVYEEENEITGGYIQVPEVFASKPKIMIRIVHLEHMLLLLKLNYFMGACFQVVDPIIEENNKILLLTGTEYSGVMLMEGKPEQSEGVLTIEALGELVFGSKTVEEIASEEGVSMSTRLMGELRKIVPLSKIYLNEIV